MSTEKINIRLTTEANLCIGGTPRSFEIGGVDLHTVTDYNGNPYIPASSFKGALRNIVRDKVKNEDAVALQIGEAYRRYLEAIRKTAEDCKQIKNQERINSMKEHFDAVLSDVSAEYLFGIQGFNHTPKLLFNDFILDHKPKGGVEELFSIDSKNVIEYSANNIAANPRQYKTVRPGVVFRGEILFSQIDKLETADLKAETIRKFIENTILEFNDGIYRLGNSGSRGYGRVQIELIQE